MGRLDFLSEGASIVEILFVWHRKNSENEKEKSERFQHFAFRFVSSAAFSWSCSSCGRVEIVVVVLPRCVFIVLYSV